MPKLGSNTARTVYIHREGETVLGPVVQIDEERIQSHLDEVIRATVEETLNGLLEADQLCGARTDVKAEMETERGSMTEMAP